MIRDQQVALFPKRQQNPTNNSVKLRLIVCPISFAFPVTLSAIHFSLSSRCGAHGIRDIHRRPPTPYTPHPPSFHFVLSSPPTPHPPAWVCTFMACCSDPKRGCQWSTTNVSNVVPRLTLCGHVVRATAPPRHRSPRRHHTATWQQRTETTTNDELSTEFPLQNRVMTHEEPQAS